MKDHAMDDLPPLLNARPSERAERRRDLGPRAVGTPYIIGGVMMILSAFISLLHAIIAPKVNPAPDGMGFMPGFQFVGMLFHLALGIGLFAGTAVARIATLVLMGISGAMVAGHGFNQGAVSARADITRGWPAATQSTAAIVATAARPGEMNVRMLGVAAPMSKLAIDARVAVAPMLPHGAWPLYATAIGLVIGWALMLTPPAVGLKSYSGAVLVLIAHGLAFWGLYL